MDLNTPDPALDPAVEPDAATRAAADAFARHPAEPPELALSVRRLRVDLSKGFGRRWAGDAFRTQYFNALSMSFPLGEQFFIDSVKAGVLKLPASEQPKWDAVIRGFVGQEATHRFLHAQFNDELARQGLVNRWEGWAARRIEMSKDWDVRHHVAITAAYEHFTAVLAKVVLTRRPWLEGAEPELALLWRWHAVEESEHKTVAIDLYRAMGGSERRRVGWFLWAGFLFVVESTAQTLINLHHAGELWKPRTWWQALRWTFGPGGTVTSTFWPLLRYLKPGFHPDDLETPAQAAAWIRENRDAYRIVGEA
jgi:predicted metal-dependent hydrolase